jgi:exodeoxyribonuclease VII large subunit
VISGVGHETDFTIADFVADVRAPTPSAAAELATPDVQELAVELQTLGQRLAGEVTGQMGKARWRLTAAARALRALSPRTGLLNLAQRLDELQTRTDRAMVGLLRSHRHQLAGLERALAAVSPLATLARGYAIVRRADTDVVVVDPAQVAAGDRLRVRVHRGGFEADVAG